MFMTLGQIGSNLLLLHLNLTLNSANSAGAKQLGAKLFNVDPGPQPPQHGAPHRRHAAVGCGHHPQEALRVQIRAGEIILHPSKPAQKNIQYRQTDTARTKGLLSAHRFMFNSQE